MPGPSQMTLSPSPSRSRTPKRTNTEVELLAAAEVTVFKPKKAVELAPRSPSRSHMSSKERAEKVRVKKVKKDKKQRKEREKSSKKVRERSNAKNVLKGHDVLKPSREERDRRGRAAFREGLERFRSAPRGRGRDAGARSSKDTETGSSQDTGSSLAFEHYSSCDSLRKNLLATLYKSEDDAPPPPKLQATGSRNIKGGHSVSEQRKGVKRTDGDAKVVALRPNREAAMEDLMRDPSSEVVPRKDKKKKNLSRRRRSRACERRASGSHGKDKSDSGRFPSRRRSRRKGSTSKKGVTKAEKSRPEKRSKRGGSKSKRSRKERSPSSEERQAQAEVCVMNLTRFPTLMGKAPESEKVARKFLESEKTKLLAKMAEDMRRFEELDKLAATPSGVVSADRAVSEEQSETSSSSTSSSAPSEPRE